MILTKIYCNFYHTITRSLPNIRFLVPPCSQPWILYFKAVLRYNSILKQSDLAPLFDTCKRCVNCCACLVICIVFSFLSLARNVVYRVNSVQPIPTSVGTYSSHLTSSPLITMSEVIWVGWVRAKGEGHIFVIFTEHKTHLQWLLTLLCLSDRLVYGHLKGWSGGQLRTMPLR